ncbi:MAG: GNAT family N-acetyltransferase [Anaerolineae bacterium]
MTANFPMGSYDVRSAYWNRGLATEAATAVRTFAFETLHLPRLISLIRTASRRVAEKVGMRLRGEITRYRLYAVEHPEEHR